MPYRRLLPLLLLSLLLLAAPPVRAQDTDADLVAEARRVVDQLLAGEYEAVTERFDDTMREQLPETRLRQVIEGMKLQVGALEEQIDAQVEAKPPHRAVILTLLFEQTALNARVVFDRQNQISGLFFTPNAGSAPYEPPPYADTTAFHEQPFALTRDDAPPLPGTLTLPRGDGPFPAVVLVHGSGPHDRDESVGPSKPFRDLAYGLASRGVAVLRYDKRTFVHPDAFAPGTAFTVEDEVTADVRTAARALQEIAAVDDGRVFVFGHSLGGLLVPRLVRDVDALAGGILAAAASRPLPELVLDQVNYLARLDAASAQQDQLEAMRQEALRADTLTAAAPDTLLVMGAPASYWLDLAAYDPVATARALDAPLLVLHAGRDYQVTDTDFAGWQRALSGQANVELERYPSLNHLFIAGEGPSTPAEYGRGGHVAAKVVEDVAAWVKAQ